MGCRDDSSRSMEHFKGMDANCSEWLYFRHASGSMQESVQYLWETQDGQFSTTELDMCLQKHTLRYSCAGRVVVAKPKLPTMKTISYRKNNGFELEDQSRSSATVPYHHVHVV